MAQLVEEMGQPLNDYLSLMLGDRDVATHALADTIIVALGHIGSLSDPEQLPAWVFALARREYQRRARAAAARAMPDTLGTLRRLSTGVGADESAASAAELVYLALVRLEPLEREVLVLAAMRRLLGSHSIARILGITRTEAAGIHRRALDTLQREVVRAGLGDDVTPGQLLVMVSRYLLGGASRDRVIYMCLAGDLADRRRLVQQAAGPFGPDGFPVPSVGEEGGAAVRKGWLNRMAGRLSRSAKSALRSR